MCAVSFVSDHYQKTYPWATPNDWPVSPKPADVDKDAEIARLKDIIDLLTKAQKYDDDTNQPDCEKPEYNEWRHNIEKRLKDLEKSVER